MILDRLKTVLSQNKTGANTFFVRSVLKEVLQDYVLNFIYNDSVYKNLIFTGGTCLRKIYGLPRLSEDLDFDFVNDFTIENFAQKVTIYFTEDLQYKNISTKISGGKQTVFLKFPILQELGLMRDESESNILFLRCDFSKAPSGAYTTSVNSISTPEFTFFVLSYDLPTLFANKIIAFLTRDFFKGNQQNIPFKGRDVFDIVWFLEKAKRSDWQLKPNWQRIVQGLGTDNKEEITKRIIQKTEMIRREEVSTDLLPFIESTTTLKSFTAHFQNLIRENISFVT